MRTTTARQLADLAAVLDGEPRNVDVATVDGTDHSFDRVRAAGPTVVMVETGDDPGHAPSRAVYEAAGFERWPVARYRRNLT